MVALLTLWLWFLATLTALGAIIAGVGLYRYRSLRTPSTWRQFLESRWILFGSFGSAWGVIQLLAVPVLPTTLPIADLVLWWVGLWVAWFGAPLTVLTIRFGWRSLFWTKASHPA